MHPQNLINCLLVCFTLLNSAFLNTSVFADDSPIDPNATIDDQELQGMVTGVRGMVQIRQSETEPWVKAENGMKLAEGAEFRTGPRSAVQFKFPPDQTITLDRLGTIKVLTAVAEHNKIKTDLGMTYGRTRYDIRKAGFEHESTIRSPSATLSVRGTRVGIQDGAMGFYAWSTQSQAKLFNQINRQNMTFGEDTAVDNNGGPAKTMQQAGSVDPGASNSRDGDEGSLVTRRPGFDPNPGGGGGSIFEHAHMQKPDTSLAIDRMALVATGDLQFTLSWQQYYGADLNLSILAPNDYNSAVTPAPYSVPFPSASTGGPGGAIADTEIGDVSSAGDLVSEKVNFFGTYPLTHIVGVTNAYNGEYLSQSYQVTISVRQDEQTAYNEIGSFYGNVDNDHTNLHVLTITPENQVVVSEDVGVIPNYSETSALE